MKMTNRKYVIKQTIHSDQQHKKRGAKIEMGIWFGLSLYRGGFRHRIFLILRIYAYFIICVMYALWSVCVCECVGNVYWNIGDIPRISIYHRFTAYTKYIEYLTILFVFGTTYIIRALHHIHFFWCSAFSLSSLFLSFPLFQITTTFMFYFDAYACRSCLFA